MKKILILIIIAGAFTSCQKNAHDPVEKKATHHYVFQLDETDIDNTVAIDPTQISITH